MNDYLTHLMRAWQRGTIVPGVTNVEVRHDGWCSALRGGDTCTCNPEIVIRRAGGNVRVLADGTTEPISAA